MDISTGHMVLAYMEDHLKNKQRLEQEWVALCGYEAEPCATTIAFKVVFGIRKFEVISNINRFIAVTFIDDQSNKIDCSKYK